MGSTKGYVNRAKSGAKALTARVEQQAARGKLDRRRPPAAPRPTAPTAARARRKDPMSEIEVEHKPSVERLAELGVLSWPIWTKEVSTFPWSYDSAETCYFLEGDVVVTPEG